MKRSGIIRWAALLCAGGIALACRPDAEPGLTAQDRAKVAAEIERKVKTAYDLGSADVLQGMMSLYPARGSVYSSSGGSVTTTRDSLEASVRQFWNYVGRNMREPKWEWTFFQVDVLSPATAVMTATYRVPHFTPAGRPHVIGGAWTAVFARRDGEWAIVHEHLSDSPSP